MEGEVGGVEEGPICIRRSWVRWEDSQNVESPNAKLEINH